MILIEMLNNNIISVPSEISRTNLLQNIEKGQLFTEVVNLIRNTFKECQVRLAKFDVRIN